MTVAIYSIRNTVNGKSYIGSSNALDRRWVGHRRELRRNGHHCVALQRAWNKYGEEAFEFSALEFVEESERLAREDYWIAKDGRYNSAKKASAFFSGGRHSEESRRKMSESHKRRYQRCPPRPVSIETRKKMSDSAKKKRLSEDHRRHIGEAQIGRVKSAETCAKLSASLKGKPKPYAIGKKHSPEWCRNISIGRLAGTARRRLMAMG